MKAAIALLALSLLAWSSDTKLIYTKDFPGSMPAWVQVQLTPDGRGIYKEAQNDDEPVEFELTQADADAIFELVNQLGKLTKPLESNLKVANMGMKTFRLEEGGKANEQKFNYSADPNAQDLLDWFERIVETQQLHFSLERSVRFDKLGVNKALLQFQSAFERDRLVGVNRFLPLLDRVAKNDSYMHMARERAASLADFIRTPRPAVAGSK
jgi:hypothetical protein